MQPLPEPWLRGALVGVSPFVAPLVRSFEQAREDLAHWTEGLGPDELWARPGGLPAVGFQLRHIAGSVDRLGTYLAGGQLSEEQMRALSSESAAGAEREELLTAIDQAFARCVEIAKSIEDLQAARAVGRKALPTTAMGLIVHIAEHTQRHVGQAITTAKLCRKMS